jgi:hypothetical protein
MTDAHTPEMLDDVAVYALGALPPAEAHRVRAHIDTCEACRAEYAALAATAAGVGVAAETAGDAAACPSTLLKPRIMRVVRAEAVPQADRADSPAAMPFARKPAAVWPAYLATAACLLVAILAVVSSVKMSWQVDAMREEIARASAGSATLARSLNSERDVLDDMTAASAKRYRASDGEVVTNGARVYLAMHDLPSPPAGKVYQAWTLPKGSKTMAPSLTFTPDSHGVAVLALPVDAKATTVVAVSVEPAGGSMQPTSKPVMVVPLT